MPRLIVLFCVAWLGCSPIAEPPADSVPVRGAAHLRLTPTPDPAPHEAPRPFDVWRAHEDGWVLDTPVLTIAPGDRARVDARGNLIVHGRVVADQVMPQLAVAGETVVFVRQMTRPDRDLWRYSDGRIERLTTDGTSDRPVFAPDGALLWITAIDGRARWVMDGRPLAGSAAMAPPPVRSQTHRWVDGRLIYDAGDALWSIAPHSGEAGPR